MTWDDLIYALLLIISLFLGMYSSKLNVNVKMYFSCSIGLIFSVCVAGFGIWHSFFVTIISITMIKFRIANFPILVFIFTFGYLVFFRTCHFIGFKKPPSYSNAIQLILTLKLIGAAFEVKDSDERRRKLEMLNCNDNNNLKMEIKYYNVDPSIADLFCYSYCFVGFLTGPYFKLRVFLDHLSNHKYKSKNMDKDIWSRLQQVSPQIKLAAANGVGYLILSHFYYIEYAKSVEFFSYGFFYRFMFMVIMFIVFRMRMYFAWLVSEAVCICASMGAYPPESKPLPGHGPSCLTAIEAKANSKSAYQDDFTTVKNLSIAGCEWTPTVRDGMRSWNMSVQYWLATYVYRRCPKRSLRTTLTMLVSAFWHGVHPGYYLSFMTIPLSLRAEESLARLLNISEFNSPKSRNEIWSYKNITSWKYAVRWFYKMRVFDYCCMGFLLLEAGATIRYWWSVWFIMHVSMIALILLDYTFNKNVKKHE